MRIGRQSSDTSRAQVASAGWPPSPPPEWVNLYFVMFNYRQWVSYELQNYIASDELNYACKNDDHQCVQLCSLPSVKRYQVWGSPHSPSQERSIAYNISDTQVRTGDQAPSFHTPLVPRNRRKKISCPDGDAWCL